MEKLNCTICQWIQSILDGTHPGFVKERQTGYLILADHQYFEGYCLFLAKTHLSELHQLQKNERMLFLDELTQISEAVYKAFKPKKINYELLGNLTPHMHWHIIPRYGNDPHPEKSIWELDKNIIFNPSSKPSLDQLNRIKGKLINSIESIV